MDRNQILAAQTLVAESKTALGAMLDALDRGHGDTVGRYARHVAELAARIEALAITDGTAELSDLIPHQ